MPETIACNCKKCLSSNNFPDDSGYEGRLRSYCLTPWVLNSDCVRKQFHIGRLVSIEMYIKYQHPLLQYYDNKLGITWISQTCYQNFWRKCFTRGNVHDAILCANCHVLRKLSRFAQTVTFCAVIINVRQNFWSNVSILRNNSKL